MERKMENIHKITNGHTWKSPFSAPCPALFSATLRLSVLSFLLQFHQYSFPQNPQRKLLRSSPFSFPHLPFFSKHFSVLPLIPPWLLFFFLSLYLGFAFSMISTATTFSATSSVSPPCSHLSGRHLFCPIPLAASKSEVDSLWPLRTWHVARWDSDTLLKMRFAKTNRGKATHA